MSGRSFSSFRKAFFTFCRRLPHIYIQCKTDTRPQRDKHTDAGHANHLLGYRLYIFYLRVHMHVGRSMQEYSNPSSDFYCVFWRGGFYELINIFI